jgi:hypothetical protein
LIGDRGMIEIKCPNTATHIATLLGKSIDGKYIKQMQVQMACADRDWCDFVSFDPRMSVDLQMYVERVHRDPDMIADIEHAARVFLKELEYQIEKLTKISGAAA